MDPWHDNVEADGDAVRLLVDVPIPLITADALVKEPELDMIFDRAFEDVPDTDEILEISLAPHTPPLATPFPTETFV